MDIVETLSGAVTTDVLIIAIVFLAIFFFSVIYGKSNSIALLFSLYFGILGFVSFPFMEEFIFLKSSEIQIVLSRIAIFAVIVAFVYTAIQRSVYAEYPDYKILKLVQAGILSLSSTALIFAFAYHTLPVATLYDFGESIDALFLSEYFFWWLAAPLGALFFVSR
ncbi:hypothetical protein HYW58_00480 [Candidatus Kaiserbacteria bacterium]|nr:hypothetical protein [Candidatus Kaiserbacteria bacterium]